MSTTWIPAAVAVALAAHADVVVQRHRGVEGVHLLALSGGDLLAWNDLGGAVLRNEKGDWTDRFQLPVAHVWALVPDGSGFLVSGETADIKLIVTRFDARAREVQRWRAADPGWQLLVEGSRRWYVEPEGLVELLADGQLGALEPFADLPQERPRLPRVLVHEGRKLICYGGRPSENRPARASCGPPGGQAWQLEDGVLLPASNCGPWVVAHNLRQDRLVVASFDGQILSARRYPHLVVFSCVDSGTLILGAGPAVELIRLPAQSPLWTHRVSRGKGVAVAATKEVVAFHTDASSDTMVMRR